MLKRYLFLRYIMVFVLLMILLLLFPLFFPTYYISELLISFLPYITAISWIFIIISFVYLKKKMKPDYRFPAHRYIRGVAFLMFCFLFFWYSKQFNHFYVQEPFTQELSTWSLKILFANIHKDNTQYEDIKKLISDTNPDMLMFVEFADHHYDNLKPFLQDKYPYINSTTRSKKFVGSIVFSKYPISNKADTFPQWMRRYGYFSLMHKGQQIYFYLVHTSSPDSYSHFIMRNEQLTTLVQNFETHEAIAKHSNIVIAGDFNVTPWSSYYSILTTAFSGSLTNITKRVPFLFTRQLKAIPLFLAHIDHVWTSSWMMVQNFQTISLPWSDHKAFLFTLNVWQNMSK